MTPPRAPFEVLLPIPSKDSIGEWAQEGIVVGGIELLNSFVPVFLTAFVITLLLTPIVRRVAVAAEVIDRPDQVRKEHAYPIAYLGGIAVFFGVLGGIAASYMLVRGQAAMLQPIPISIAVGMVAIALTGLLDDIWKLYPRLKIAGQLVAAAALATESYGTQVAMGLLGTTLGAPETVLWQFTLPGPITAALTAGDVYYWLGVALIGVFVIGACNATNLIDGLDGLLTGSVAVMCVGFLFISLLLGTVVATDDPDHTLVAARVALSLALLGAVLGFLPYNFNPAVIFLGDTGSLLLGYLCITIILMFGEHGQTSLVMAGLIIFALPIMDTMLAIMRRWLAGVSFSQADANHIHHQIKRSLGSVRRAALALYGITALFTLMGVALAAVRLLTTVRPLVIYAITFVAFASIAAVAIKIARRGAWTIAASRTAGSIETPIAGAVPPFPDGPPRHEGAAGDASARPVESPLNASAVSPSAPLVGAVKKVAPGGMPKGAAGQQ